MQSFDLCLFMIDEVTIIVFNAKCFTNLCKRVFFSRVKFRHDFEHHLMTPLGCYYC